MSDADILILYATERAGFAVDLLAVMPTPQPPYLPFCNFFSWVFAEEKLVLAVSLKKVLGKILETHFP